MAAVQRASKKKHHHHHHAVDEGRRSDQGLDDVQWQPEPSGYDDEVDMPGLLASIWEEFGCGGSPPQAEEPAAPPSWASAPREVTQSSTEIAKPAIVAGTVGVGAEVPNLSNQIQGVQGAGTFGTVEATGPAAAGAAGLLSLAQGGKALYDGHKRAKQARAAGDEGGVTYGKEQRSEGVRALGNATPALVKAGADLGVASHLGKGETVMQVTGLASDTTNAAANAASVVGGVAGLVGGAINGGLALHELHKARGVHGAARAGRPVTPEGQSWLDRIASRQSKKSGIQGLKLAAAAAGIVGGALLLASNPVGWVIALGAAAVGVGIIATKLFKGAKHAHAHKKALKARQNDAGITDAMLADVKALKEQQALEPKRDKAMLKREAKDAKTAAKAQKKADKAKSGSGRRWLGLRKGKPKAAEVPVDSVSLDELEQEATNPALSIDELEAEAEADDGDEAQAPMPQLEGDLDIDEQVLADDPDSAVANLERIQALTVEVERELSENYRVATDIRTAVAHDPTPGAAVDDDSPREHELGHDGALAASTLGVSRAEAASASGADLMRRRMAAGTGA